MSQNNSFGALWHKGNGREVRARKKGKSRKMKEWELKRFAKIVWYLAGKEKSKEIQGEQLKTLYAQYGIDLGFRAGWQELDWKKEQTNYNKNTRGAKKLYGSYAPEQLAKLAQELGVSVEVNKKKRKTKAKKAGGAQPRSKERVGGVNLVGNKNVGVAPHKIWVWDVTHVDWRGKSYKIATILDLGSRDVVAQSIIGREDIKSMLAVLDAGLEELMICPEILHGDGGLGYEEIAKELELRGIKISRPNRGELHTNQVIERYNRTLQDGVRALVRRWGKKAEGRTLEEALAEVLENYRKETHTLFGVSPREAQTLLLGITLPKRGEIGNRPAGRELRKRITEEVRQKREEGLWEVVGSKENWEKLTEIVDRVGPISGVEPMGQLQMKLQVFQIAQQERHYQDLRGLIEGMNQKVQDMGRELEKVGQIEEAIKRIRKDLDGVRVTGEELPERIKELVDLELKRFEGRRALGEALGIEAKKINERFTEQFMKKEAKALAVVQQKQPVRERGSVQGKLRVREVPDSVLDARDAELALAPSKSTDRLRMAYKIIRLTGMRVGNLLELDDDWFEKELLEESVRYVLIKQDGGKSYCEVYISKPAREELQGMYREYKDNYGENPFNIGRERLTKSLNADLKKTGIPRITSHTLRSSVITKIVRNMGASVAQQFMRHRNISTTARYVGNLLSEDVQRRVGELLNSGGRARSNG
jgi:integrase/transposase InsO family protein